MAGPSVPHRPATTIQNRFVTALIASMACSRVAQSRSRVAGIFRSSLSFLCGGLPGFSFGFYILAADGPRPDIDAQDLGNGGIGIERGHGPVQGYRNGRKIGVMALLVLRECWQGRE